MWMKVSSKIGDKNYCEYDPSSPWAIEANLMYKNSDESLEWCRDYVILKWLERGCTKPFNALLSMGKAPSPAVLKYFAKMLLSDYADNEEVPFELTIKPRNGKRGARKSVENEVRDYLIYENIESYMQKNGRGGYEAAISEFSKEHSIGVETTRKAYDKHKKSNYGKNNGI